MPINVFVSSRMKEGSIEKEKRDLVKEAIEELSPNFRPILFEYEPASPKHIKDWWRDKITEEDTRFLILILNDTLSAAVFDEFSTATENNREIIVYLVDEDQVLSETLEVIEYPDSGLLVPEEELLWFYNRLKNIKFKGIKDFDDERFKDAVKAAILQYLEVPSGLPRELEGLILKRDDTELKRILEVYVEPKRYNDAYSTLDKNRFLIITGDANIGKTSMALQLADRMRSENAMGRVIKAVGGRTDIMHFKDLKDSVVIFDDAFGSTKFGDQGDYSGSIKEILDLKDNNYVILTTRRVILDEVKSMQTRFTEYLPNIKDYIIEFEQEGAYAGESLKKILDNHLDFYSKTDKIGKKERRLAEENAEDIIRKLRFPHNIDMLVKEELKKVADGEKEIDAAIESAKHIKTIAKDWFLNLDNTRKYFVFTIAIFSTLGEAEFEGVYEEIVDKLKNRYSDLIIEDISNLRQDTSAYITGTGWIEFKHPNYLEGVMEGINERCKRDLSDIIPTLKELVDWGPNVRNAVVYVLWVIGDVLPPVLIPILKEWAEDKDLHVKRAAAYALGEIEVVRPDDALPILRGLADDINFHVRWAVADALWEIGKVRLVDTLPILKELAGDEDWIVRVAAVNALGEIGKVKPVETLPILRELAEDDDTNVREAVVDALGEIGKVKPDETLSVLKEWVKDGDEDVREAANEAIREIQSRD